MFVPMVSNFISKLMFTSMTSIDVSEHAPVMTRNRFSMKKLRPANTYSVLRVVENGIAMREQIDALTLVPMDSDSIGKVMLKSMTRIDESEHAPAITHNSSLMKNTITVRTSSVLRAVD